MQQLDIFKPATIEQVLTPARSAYNLPVGEDLSAEFYGDPRQAELFGTRTVDAGPGLEQHPLLPDECEACDYSIPDGQGYTEHGGLVCELCHRQLVEAGLQAAGRADRLWYRS